MVKLIAQPGNKRLYVQPVVGTVHLSWRNQDQELIGWVGTLGKWKYSVGRQCWKNPKMILQLELKWYANPKC